MAALLALIELLREAIQQERMEADLREELQAELATLQAQTASPKPKWAIIKATAGSTKPCWKARQVVCLRAKLRRI